MKAQMGHLFRTRRTEQEGEHWMTISDLMAGLMMVFLFISIALMRTAFLERDKIKEVAVAYRDGQVAINCALWEEFENDLPKWEAELDAATLAIEFKSPVVLFETGEIALQPRFVEILNDFFRGTWRLSSNSRPPLKLCFASSRTRSTRSAKFLRRERYRVSQRGF